MTYVQHHGKPRGWLENGCKQLMNRKMEANNKTHTLFMVFLMCNVHKGHIFLKEEGCA